MSERSCKSEEPSTPGAQPSIRRTSPARGPFCRILRRELDALTFAQQLEHGASHRAAVEEVLDPALVADEPESFVDEEPCDCPGRHKPEALRSADGLSQPQAELEIRGQSRQFSARSQAGCTFRGTVSVWTLARFRRPRRPLHPRRRPRRPRRTRRLRRDRRRGRRPSCLRTSRGSIVGQSLRGRLRGRLGLVAVGRRICRPEMPAATRAHPELVRCPRHARTRIAHVHLRAATHAANLEIALGHARDSITLGR